ncbi:hypothetical protein IWX78_002168 [Mycetocola sp. CAN_C7]|uniref:hypothetical protein n=1 Tax=Mycetocola sp. CAN_C7 TaxID=2787724 RepID=UPI0018C8F5A9
MTASSPPNDSATPAVRRVLGSRRAVLPGASGADPTPQERVDPVRAAEDTDAPWGVRAQDSNDDQLKRDVPPHWA